MPSGPLFLLHRALLISNATTISKLTEPALTGPLSGVPWKRPRQSGRPEQKMPSMTVRERYTPTSRTVIRAFTLNGDAVNKYIIASLREGTRRNFLNPIHREFLNSQSQLTKIYSSNPHVKRSE